MERLERLAKITDLLRTMTHQKIEGRKRFHKLIYLLQERGVDFGEDFVFSHYGVFSPTLADDLRVAKQWELLNEDAQGEHYVIGLKQVKGVDLKVKWSSDDAKLVRELAEKSAQFLEVLSTIVYLKDKGYSGSYLEKKLAELKGHLNEHFDKANAFARNYYDIAM